MAALEFQAIIEVASDSKIILGKSPWAPNILLDGTFYPGRILRCDACLGAGERGPITLGILYDKVEPQLSEGTAVELRDGPTIIVARGKIM